MIHGMMSSIGRAVGQYLSQPVSNYRPLTTSAPSILAQTLRPGDVLLVEGNTRDQRRDQVPYAVHLVPRRAVHR